MGVSSYEEAEEALLSVWLKAEAIRFPSPLWVECAVHMKFSLAVNKKRMAGEGAHQSSTGPIWPPVPSQENEGSVFYSAL